MRYFGWSLSAKPPAVRSVALKVQPSTGAKISSKFADDNQIEQRTIANAFDFGRRLN